MAMIKFNLIVSLLILPIMATDIAAQARFTPKELPYAYDALAPQVSEERRCASTTTNITWGM